MQRFSNKPRRPKAKAAEVRRKAKMALWRPHGDRAARAEEWHDIATRGLLTALSIFIAFQLGVALIGSARPVAKVGDRIVIDAGSARAGGVPLITGMDGAGAAARTCRLDVAVMKHPGGVLTVLESGPAGVLLSWAGGATAPGAANCTRHDIMVSANDYATLLNTGPQNINAR